MGWKGLENSVPAGGWRYSNLWWEGAGLTVELRGGWGTGGQWATAGEEAVWVGEGQRSWALIHVGLCLDLPWEKATSAGL